jgi:hypothetical protein
MWGNFRGLALKNFKERDEDEEPLARTFKVHHKVVVNEYIIVRLEEIEHYFYFDYDSLDHYFDFEDIEEVADKRGEYWDYEWVIRIYVNNYDVFTDGKYNITKYDESIIRVQFLPWKNTEYGWGWDEALFPSIVKKFEEVCSKIQKWVDNDYEIGPLDLALTLQLLKKLNEAGEDDVERILMDKLRLSDIFSWVSVI